MVCVCSLTFPIHSKICHCPRLDLRPTLPFSSELVRLGGYYRPRRTLVVLEQSGRFLSSLGVDDTQTVTRWYRSTGDLLVVVLWTAAAVVTVLGVGVEQSLLRTLLVIPLVLFFPGYALLEALFPERSSDAQNERPDSDPTTRAATAGSRLVGLDGLERFVLAIVVSLGLVPLVAFVINYTPYGLRLGPVMTAVAGVTLALSVLGFVRRLRLPAERRRSGSLVRAPATLWSRYVVGEADGGRTRRPLIPRTGAHRLFNVLLVVSLLTLVGSVGYAAVTPPGDDTGFTEAYLVTQTDTGEYTSEELPNEFTAGESRQLSVALGNHEHERVTYTVVAALDGTELSRVEATVAAGETGYVEREITPQQTGDSVPLQFFVYKGDAPDTPTPETAYRTVSLWVTIQ